MTFLITSSARLTKTVALGGLATLATLGGLSALSVPAEAVGPREAMDFALDTVHSSVNFELTHFGVSHAWGRFNEMEGSFSFDEEDLSKSKISLAVMADSVDTNNEKRDQHLRGTDFFTTKQFPKITFESKSVKATGDNTMEVTGELTFLGKTQEVVADATLVGMAETPQGYKAGFNATMTIDRTDFGCNTYLDSLGKDVTLHVSVEGVRR
ncbi:MAG: YceI family protein [Planctomycetota bacterium]